MERLFHQGLAATAGRRAPRHQHDDGSVDGYDFHGGVDVVLVMTASVNEGPRRRSFGHHIQFDDDAIYDSKPMHDGKYDDNENPLCKLWAV
jgi:hypothetical protein